MISVSLRTVPRPALWLGIAVFVQAALALSYCLTRLNILYASVIDVGAYLQALQSIITTGKPLVTLHPLGSVEIHWLGFHFTPILYLIAPLYALIPSPTTLHVIHVACIALAAIPLYRAASLLGLTSRAALVAACAYLFNPFTLNAGIWGFQEPSLAVLFVSVAVWALVAKRFRWLAACAVLLVLTKEHYGIAAIGFGILWWRLHGDRRRALMLIAFGTIALTLVLFVLMPYFRGTFIHPMLDASARIDRYSWLFTADKWFDSFRAVALDSSAYLFTLFGFFCLLPLGGLWWLLAGLADFAIILPANTPLYRSPFNFYSLALVPPVVMAACAGYLRIRPHITNYRLALIIPACSASAYIFFSCLPLPFAYDPFELQLRPQLVLSEGDAKAVRDIHKLLPTTSALGVQKNIGMFFNTYPTRYVFPRISASIDAVILHIASPRSSDMISVLPQETRLYLLTIDELLRDPKLKVIYWHKPWLVLSGHGKEDPKGRADARDTLDDVSKEQWRRLQMLYNVTPQ